MSRVLEAEPRLCVRPGCLLGTSEGSPKGYGVGPSFPAAQAGTGERAVHGISGGFLNVAGVIVHLGMGTCTSLFLTLKALSANSLPVDILGPLLCHH